MERPGADEIRKRAAELMAGLLAVAGLTPAPRDDAGDAAALGEKATACGPTCTFPLLTSAANKGAEVVSAMRLANDGQDEVCLRLTSTDLVSEYADRMPAACILFRPNPVRLGPRTRGTVELVTQVPSDAKGGTYCGLIRVSGQPGAKAYLEVKVT
jgi:hypothetical protein